MARTGQAGGTLDTDERRPRFIRPYEWTHADPHFIEWLECQGLSEESWTPALWPTPSAGRERR
jgi:hypothetical protein